MEHKKWRCWHHGWEGDSQIASEIPSVLSPATITLHIYISFLYPTWEGGNLLYSGNGMTPSKSFTRSVSDIIKCFTQRVSKVSGEQGASSCSLTHLPTLTWSHWETKPSLQERAQQNNGSTGALSPSGTPWGRGGPPPSAHPHLSHSSLGTHQSLLIMHTHRASLRMFLFLQNEK